MLNVELRLEQPNDYHHVDELTYRTFLNAEEASGMEALLAHRLRTVPEFVSELDFVAVVDGNIVGNIMYSKGTVVDSNGIAVEDECLSIAPLTVAKGFQRQGIGTALVQHSLERARDLGYRVVFLFGHISYYPRFGFMPAARFGFTTAYGDVGDAFMVVPLYEGALEGMSGCFKDAPVFAGLNQTESDEFNKQFE
jgi:predicted N-acetyltransferase YhbS